MKKNYFLLFPLILFSYSISARWANPTDALFHYDLWRTTIQVEKDGTYTEEVEYKAKILKNSAIQYVGNFSLTYNEQSQKVDILSAKTINGSKEFPVDKKFIEDKPLASSAKGFDQTRQILIIFPQVQVGSHVYIRYRRHYKIVPFKNVFSDSFTFWNEYYKNMELTIRSARPLHYEVNNPGKFLKSSYQIKKGNKRPYIFKLRLKRPLFKRILDERYIFTDRNLFPWIKITTEKKWSKVFKHLASEYEKRIKEPLPKLHQSILKSAQQIKTGSEDQINSVISALIEKIRYMGDWRPINGGYIPRSLSVIAKTSFGDCKDFSVSLAAILRNLGFKAQVAAVSRNHTYHSSYDYKLPNIYAFNHAIVRAEIKGKVFWLDPTNSMTYARGIFTDIADRPAVILQYPKPKLQRIPKMYSSGAEYILTRNFEITKKDLVKMKGSAHFKGRSAIPYTGMSLNNSKQSIDYMFINQAVGDISLLKKWKVEGYDLKSRIVKNFSVDIAYTIEKDNSDYFGNKTQLGPALYLGRIGALDRLNIRSQDRISDLFLGPPQKVTYISKLKNIKPLGKLKFNCNLKSKWFNIRRDIKSRKPLIVKDTYEFKKPFIPARELKNPQFLQLQKGIQSCFKQFFIIYKTIK